MLLGRKKDEPTDSGSLPSLEGDDAPDMGNPDIPKIKSQEELLAEQTAAEEASKQEVLAGLQWKMLPAGYDISSQMRHNELWTSDDCEAAAIGRDWQPIVSVNDKLYTPASFWQELAGGTPPHVPTTDSVGSSAMMAFAEKVLSQDLEYECSGHVPLSRDYDNNEDFGNAWTDFRNAYPALAALYDEIYEKHIAPQMSGAWYEVDPDGYSDYQVERMAKWAVNAYPNEDVTEQTDQAYFRFVKSFDFDSDDEAPDVLDPSNPAHQVWIEVWLALNEAIKDL